MESKQKTLEAAFTTGQKILAKKHGTPAEFAAAVYKTVPEFLSMDEARKAIEDYNRDWENARRTI